MIVRTAFRCETCDQNHIVRIGMGHDDRQEHRFPCRACGEDMVVALNVDYATVSTRPEAVENAVLSRETADALVVNVHANFVVEGASRFEDRTFPHMAQMHVHHEAAERYGAVRAVPFAELGRATSRPFRRPDYADEWKLLKKAWSLHMRDRQALFAKEMAAASARFYADDPLNHLADWVWRFAMFLGATKYEQVLRGMMAAIKRPLADRALAPFLEAYGRNSRFRAKRYFEIMRDYFAAWSEFSQVHFAVAKGVPVSHGHVATTSGFNAVKMFYGSAFEAFASSVDVLAYINNVLDGRRWEQFRTIDADTYRRSDKAKRFDAFAGRSAFAALCVERNNRLRNASHHGALHFDSETGMLSYRDGKGDTGDLVSLSYAEYLSRCSALFFQIVTLLRFELLLCQTSGTPYPI